MSVCLSGTHWAGRPCNQAACSVSSAHKPNIEELLTSHSTVNLSHWPSFSFLLSALCSVSLCSHLSEPPHSPLILLSSLCLKSEDCIIHYENWLGINDVGFHTNTHIHTHIITIWLRFLFSRRNKSKTGNVRTEALRPAAWYRATYSPNCHRLQDFSTITIAVQLSCQNKMLAVYFPGTFCHTCLFEIFTIYSQSHYMHFSLPSVFTLSCDNAVLVVRESKTQDMNLSLVPPGWSDRD